MMLIYTCHIAGISLYIYPSIYILYMFKYLSLYIYIYTHEFSIISLSMDAVVKFHFPLGGEDDDTEVITSAALGAEHVVLFGRPKTKQTPANDSDPAG